MFGIVHGDLRLACVCLGQGNPFHEAPNEQFCVASNLLVGKVASNDHATLKVTELFSKVNLLPLFVYGDCMAVCSILYTCLNRIWLK